MQKPLPFDIDSMVNKELTVDNIIVSINDLGYVQMEFDDGLTVTMSRSKATKLIRIIDLAMNEKPTRCISFRNGEKK
jgi:hypothetical protein